MIRIPFFARSESAAPLNRVIELTAADACVRSIDVAVTMSYFLQHLVDEVSLGRTVSIPGFGAFAPWLLESSAALARDPTPRCHPKFSPSRCFINQVRLEAPHTDMGKRDLQQHRRHHSVGPRSDRSGSRTWTAMKAFRDSISAQLLA